MLHAECKILVPQPEVKPNPPTLQGSMESYHWTTREVPTAGLKMIVYPDESPS